MENTMQIAVTLPMHASNEDIAAALRHRAGLFEGMTAKDAGARTNTDAAPVTKKAKKTAPIVEETEAEESEDDEDLVPKKKATATKKAKSFDDDEDEETEVEEEEETPAPKAAKGKKAPKISLEDVSDACREAAKENGRPAVIAILKKKFKVESVNDLKPEQFAGVIEAVTSI